MVSNNTSVKVARLDERVGGLRGDFNEFKEHTYQKVDAIRKDVADIKENHLPHLSADVSWLMRFFWIIATASIGSLVATLFNLLTTRS